MRLLLFIPALLLAGSQSMAQWTSYTNVSQVQQVTCTDDTVFCATTGGVLRVSIDGLDRSVLTNVDGLLDNDLSSVVADEYGYRWFATASLSPEAGGITVFDQTGVPRYYSSYDGIGGSSITSLAVAGGWLAVGTDGGVAVGQVEGDSLVGNGRFEFYTRGKGMVDDSVAAVAIRSGVLWVGTRAGVSRTALPVSTWTHYSHEHGLPEGTVQSLMVLGDTVWVGTVNGVARYDGERWREVSTGLPSENVRSLAWDGSTVWAATSRGVARWSEIAIRWTPVTAGLLTLDVRSVSSSPDGMIWAGTWNGGLSQLIDTLWQPIEYESIARNRLCEVSVDRDSSIWCSYNSPSLGVSHLRVDGMWEHYGPDQYPFLKSVLGIAVDSEGGRWFGTWGFGLVHLTPDGRWRVYDTSNSPLPVNTIGPVVTDDTGNVYISAYQEALCRFNVRDLTWKVYRSDFTVAVNEIALDSTGTLWLGSADRGVAYITPDGHADRLVGVASQRTTALAVDRDGRVWVGNLGGVHMVVDRQIVTTYTATGDDRGLLSDVVWDMVGDWDGGMWFESTGSVSRRRPDGKWVHYLPDSGLVSGEIGDIESSLAFDQERGILWIVTGKGLSRYETGIVAWSSPNLEGVVCFPNPFVPGLGHREVTIDHLPSDATVRIYSLCGELIQTLGAPDQFARTYWNGLNGHGKQVASGIYLVSVVTPHAHWVGKLAVVR